MNPRFFFLFLLLGLTGIIQIGCTHQGNTDYQKPNIIYILADDLGYGSIGAYGQKKIETPNIDALARNGMKFTQHYSGSTVCAPSRYMLMTGKHPGHAYIRGNSEVGGYDYEVMRKNPKLEGQTPIPDSTITVAEVLKKAGYQTGAIGKWGLGGPFTEGHPNNQGFDLFYGYLCQRQAHTYYPDHLWKNGERVFLDNELENPHQPLPDSINPYAPDLYTKFHKQPDYAPELMQQETINFIEENQDDPFFLYLPNPIPHSSLQAPQRWIDYYHDKFGEEEPYTGNRYVPVRYPHATYAAMISYLDEEVGKIIQKLKESGLYDNTLIIFTSDNGPAWSGGPDPAYFEAAAPFKGEKRWAKTSLHEGGIRVPMIAHWPGVIEDDTETSHISSFWDIMPTFSDIAGINPPDNIDGISFLPLLKGNTDEQEQHEYLYWEFPGKGAGGQQAVRMGKWKGIRKDIHEGNMDIELYNLATDIREQNNVADQYPEVIKEIERIMEVEHKIPKVGQFKMKVLEESSGK